MPADLHPAPSELCGRPSRQVHDDWSVAKPREECQPFTYTLHDPTSYRRESNIKAQAQFLKRLETLAKKQAREAKKRAKTNA